jgi:hypothetical protein
MKLTETAWPVALATIPTKQFIASVSLVHVTMPGHQLAPLDDDAMNKFSHRQAFAAVTTAKP